MPDSQVYTFKARPAKREGVGLFVGLAGGTGSGKTYSALRLARGIVGPTGRILVADTEGRRASHYTDFFKFDTVDVEPPFRPGKFEALVKYAEAEQYDVLVIDSFSHEHNGEGGVLEWHDEIVEQAILKARQRARENEQVDEDRIANAQNMRAWITPKMAHKAMVNSFLQRRIPIIFCLRAEEKIKVLPNGRPEPMGWMPICDKNFGYELTMQITLSNEHPGKVDYNLPRKIQRQHLALFPDNAEITEEAGAKLAAWARGDDIKPEPKPAPTEPEKPAVDRTTAIADELIARIGSALTPAASEAIFQEDLVHRRVAWMADHRVDQYQRIMAAADKRNAELAEPSSTEGEQAPEV